MNCVFCPNKLDNSDEHIILNSLNGKLHSKEIICSECNNYFGLKLDNIAKSFFNLILLSLEFKNASGSIAENLEGQDNYLIRKGGGVSQRKPLIIENKFKNKTLISIRGDEKNTLKYFEKYSKRLEEKGGKKIAHTIRTGIESSPLRIKANFNSNSDIMLLVNKMAIEYCAYNKIKKSYINNLAIRVRNLDTSLKNVFYCNFKEEIREFKSGEITHIIKLWSNKGKIYTYIELFNIICVVVLISTDYNGNDFDYQYYQDCITGEKLTEKIDINKNEIENVVRKGFKDVDFSEMVNKLFHRKQERDIQKNIDLALKEIKDKLEIKFSEGEITETEFNESYIKEATEFLAEYMYENPYLFDDVDDANNDELNYIHSNLRENQFDDFCKKNAGLIGKEIKFNGNNVFLIEKFVKTPFTNQNGINIIKVYVVLYDGIDREYIPYRDFFEGIKIENNC